MREPELPFLSFGFLFLLRPCAPRRPRLAHERLRSPPGLPVPASQTPRPVPAPPAPALLPLSPVSSPPAHRPRPALSAPPFRTCVLLVLPVALHQTRPRTSPSPPCSCSCSSCPLWPSPLVPGAGPTHRASHRACDGQSPASVAPSRAPSPSSPRCLGSSSPASGVRASPSVSPTTILAAPQAGDARPRYVLLP